MRMICWLKSCKRGWLPSCITFLILLQAIKSNAIKIIKKILDAIHEKVHVK